MDYQPLAIKLRPKTLNDIVGQNHLIGEDKYISKMCETKHFKYIIFYGNPGTGKTTIATVIAKLSSYPVEFFNAVQGSKKDLDRIFDNTKEKGTIFLIIDEIHRLNKDKQDLLLPYMENGKVICIGLTTSNPLFAINPAIRSRCLLFEIKKPSENDIVTVLERGIKLYEYENNLKISYSKTVLHNIASRTNSDVRSAINVLEAILDYGELEITHDLLENVLQASCGGDLGSEDAHYNLLSAFQKSIRGSDVDAALYYLGQLLEIGDLISIERRLLVTAYEDIGLAAPEVVGRVNAATEAAKKVGLPEASLILAEIVCELALSKKSKAAHDAIKRVQKSLQRHIFEQPEYIKLNPIGLTKEESYDYDAYKDWKKIQYLPNELKDVKFLQMTGREDDELLENYSKLTQIPRTSDLKSLKNSKNTLQKPIQKINWKK